MNKIYEFDAMRRPAIKKTWLITKNQRNSIKISNKFNQKNKLFSLKNFFQKLLFTLASLFIIFFQFGFFS